MDVTAVLDTTAPFERVRPWVADLGRYSEWLSILTSAVPDADDDSVWSIELRAKVGPLARSKRLRMVRVVDADEHVRFERHEVDGRTHSPWVLDALVVPVGSGSRLTMALHYGGSFGAGLVERLLASEIDSSKERLRALVEGPSAP